MKDQKPTDRSPAPETGSGARSRLRRRTLRQLSPSELGQVVGGVDGQNGLPLPTTSSEARRCDTDTVET
jgi:hypothetical protein